MPKCSVKGCGSKYDKKLPLVSLHRLPRNEKIRRMWLESLGQEHIIGTNLEKIFICTLHFEESCVNRTLNIVRLQDNAIPTRFLVNHLKQARVALSPTTSNVMVIEKDNLEMGNREHFELATASNVLGKDNKADTSMNILNTGTTKIVHSETKLLEKLREKFAHQQKKIKRLNEKCRRQSKKLAEYKQVIENLKKELKK